MFYFIYLKRWQTPNRSDLTILDIKLHRIFEKKERNNCECVLSNEIPNILLTNLDD